MNSPNSKLNLEPLKKLLTAALGDEIHAVDFYKSWRECSDFEKISYGEYELLSKVYGRLERAKFRDDLTLRIKGITRRNWLETKIYKKELVQFFEIFEKAGIEFILLTREPLRYCLINSSENDFSLRNFQILLRHPITINILENLETAGWKPAKKLPTHLPRVEEIWFNHHTRLGIGIKQTSRIFGDEIWKTCETVELNGKKIRVADTSSYLLQILETEFLSEEKRTNGLWFIYSFLALQDQLQINWGRLSRQSRNCGLNFSLVEMLDELAGYCEPENYSKFRYLFFEKPQNKLQRAYSAYKSLKKSYLKTEEKFSNRGFLNFLRQHWKAKSLSELVEQIGRRFLKY